MANAIKKVVRAKPIGLDHLVYAKLLTDEPGETPTYGEIKHFATGISAKLTPTILESILEADDVPEEQENVVVGIDVEIGAASLTDEVYADILGHRIDDKGGIVVNTDDEAPYIALGFRAKLNRSTNGAPNYDYRWLYKGKFSEPEGSFETVKKGGRTYQTPTLKGAFIPLASTGDIQYKLRSDMPGADATVIADWFDAVPLPSAEDYTPPEEPENPGDGQSGD